MRHSILVLLVLSVLVSVPLFAQNVSAEFDRANGGELSLLVKRPSQLSGSFAFSLGSSYGTGRSNALLGSFGGTVVPDRIWFFAAAQRNEHPVTSLYGGTYGPTPMMPRIDGKATAQFGSANMLTTSVSSNRTWTDQRADFKTLHFTSVVSPNAFFSMSASQSTLKP